MPAILPMIPENITVHLGTPGAAVPNVTVSFLDYIKNVASSEIYPTWPESAIRANMYAQISFALNRYYTQHYRSQGYDFDITSSTAFDQYFVYGRDIYDNISRIADELFNSYIRRQGEVQPLFAVYCDGVNVSCPGLSQWGSVELANRGFTPYDILTFYYGDDIDIVSGVPIEDGFTEVPAVPLSEGQIGPKVQLAQIRLNRISMNFPAIPKIYPTDGVFGPSTVNAVKAFQSYFGLTPDGIIGAATYYRIRNVYNGVKNLSDLNAEGVTLEEVSTQYPNVLEKGSTGTGVLVLQYYLAYIAQFIDTVPAPAVDGIFGEKTDQAVKAFQRTYGLYPDGVVGEITWSTVYDAYLGFTASLPLQYTEGVTQPFPGRVLTLDVRGDDVKLLQEYLAYISRTYRDIPRPAPDGVYGPVTKEAVTAFQNLFSVPGEKGVVVSFVWDAITSVYRDLYQGSFASAGQFPGYTLSASLSREE
ncbi:MAG: peptidoglycan-binding protein [Clostridia bacterium]|nr:peptidoglycan-binding protein [Clostridia bacterium]